MCVSTFCVMIQSAVLMSWCWFSNDDVQLKMRNSEYSKCPISVNIAVLEGVSFGWAARIGKMNALNLWGVM